MVSSPSKLIEWKNGITHYRWHVHGVITVSSKSAAGFEVCKGCGVFLRIGLLDLFHAGFLAYLWEENLRRAMCLELCLTQQAPLLCIPYPITTCDFLRLFLSSSLRQFGIESAFLILALHLYQHTQRQLLVHRHEWKFKHQSLIFDIPGFLI